MRWFKIILIGLGASALACSALLAIALMTFRDDDYRRLAARAATRLTGYAVTIEGPFSLNVLGLSLSAHAIRLDSGPAGGSPPVSRIGTLNMRIALWPLATGTLVFRELQVEDVLVPIEIGTEAGAGDLRKGRGGTSRGVRIPVFEHLLLHNIQLDLIDRSANRTVEVRLRQGSADHQRDDGPMFIRGDGSISGKEFVVEGRLGTLASIRGEKPPYPVDMDVRVAGLHLSASGTVANIAAGKGLALHLSGETSEIADLLGMLNIQTPPLGGMEFQAAVYGDMHALRVSNLLVTSSKGARLEFALTGAVDDLTNGKGADLQITAACADPDVLTSLLPKTPPEIQKISVKGAVSEAAGVMAAEDLLIQIDGARGLSARAGGRIGLGKGLGALFPTDLDIQLEVSAPDPGLVGSMAGISLPPFGPLAIDGRIGGNARKPSFSGETRFGGTLFQSSIRAEFTGERPTIVAGFTSDAIQLKDLGITLEPPPEETPAPAGETAPPPDRIFDDRPLRLDALKAFDLVFTLDAKTVLGQGARIQDLDLDLTLENGRLRVSPANMAYEAGFTEAQFVLDASGSSPAFDLKITGVDIDVDDLLAATHGPKIVSGTLSLATDLRSAGRSGRELASNLEGDLSLAIENGRIRRIANFLSTDAINLIFAGADPRRHTDLNCLFSKIQFQQGVGDIDVLMDTPRTRAIAAGKIYLPSESIDIVINPEQKQRLIRRRTSAVKISGPLARPSARTMPLEEAARLTGKILMPYVFLPERLLGSLWYLIRQDRNASPCARELNGR